MCGRAEEWAPGTESWVWRAGWPDSLPGRGLSMEASEPALRGLPTGLFCHLTFLRGRTAFVFYVYLV